MNAMLALEKHGLENGGPYQYGGVLENTEESYNALAWEDKREKPAWADLVSLWPAIETEQKQAEVKEQLAATDLDMMRVVEDLIDAGGDVSKLPQESKDIVTARKALRAQLAGGE